MACPGCPSLSRVCRRPNVSIDDHGSELGAVTRRRDTIPVLEACPGCPSLPESIDVQMFPSQTVAASLVPPLDPSIDLQFCVLALDVHVEALTEASEANKSNAASRTRSIGQHFVLLVSCRPYLGSREMKKMTLSRQFSLRSARSGVQQGQTGSIWARAARFHSSFALEIVMREAQIWVAFGFAQRMHYRLRAIKENSIISYGKGKFHIQLVPRPPLAYTTAGLPGPTDPNDWCFSKR